MILVLVLIASVAAWMALERNNELFVLHFRNGEMRLVRGTVPVRLRQQLTESLRNLNAGEVRLRVTERSRSARLTAEWLNAADLQVLRNVLQKYPLAQLRTSEAPSANRFLRLFGVSSLVWLFGTADD
ncbi:MAG: DUF3634 family protein [Archangium sp.]|nr:DUF3634 family protein [Archangium sp.]